MGRTIELVPLQEKDKSVFIADLQASFAIAPARAFGGQGEVISFEEVDGSIQTPGAESFQVVYQGEYVGGVVVVIDLVTQVNSLDLLFIKERFNNLGLGLQVWRTIEQRYPKTKKWITVTPYFEQRNIHFYVNRCGFRIVEFFNPRHWDDSVPQQEIPWLASYFRFEKEMTSSD